MPTVTAANTPIASWQTWGMKQRVAMLPPPLGGATRHIFIYKYDPAGFLKRFKDPVFSVKWQKSLYINNLTAYSALFQSVGRLLDDP